MSLVSQTLRNNWAARCSLVAVTALVACVRFLVVRGLGDPDGYDHVAMAERFLEGVSGPVLPWLPHTLRGQHFSGQHYLYHGLVNLFMRVPRGAQRSVVAVFLATLAILALSRRRLVWLFGVSIVLSLAGVSLGVVLHPWEYVRHLYTQVFLASAGSPRALNAGMEWRWHGVVRFAQTNVLVLAVWVIGIAAYARSRGHRARRVWRGLCRDRAGAEPPAARAA